MLNIENSIHILQNNIVQEHAGIKFQELPFMTKINLRGNPNDKKFLSSASEVLNIILPTRTNTYIKIDSLKIIWLGPDEWLIIDEKGNDKQDLFSKLINSIGSQDASVTDVSENRTVIRVIGKKLFILLAKFLTLNLDNSLSGNSSVAQTLFIKVPVLLMRHHEHNREPKTKIDIFTNRSHANYVYKILVDGTKNLDF
jgi:sarcosine oxidase subunit gamma